MKRTLALVGMIAAVLIFSVESRAASERQIVVDALARMTPSVGALYSRNVSGDMKFLCSATAIGHEDGKTVILTAYHCLQKGVSYLVNFGDDRLRPLTVWKIPHYEVDEKERPRKYNQPLTDMAMFLMEGTDIPLTPAAPSSVMRPGEKIVTIGFPLGVSKITYEGIVAGYLNRPGSDQHGYILMQIFGAPGSSGSAVLDPHTGEIVGVLVSAIQAYSGLPVIFATPIDHVRYLIPVRNENGK